MKKLLLFLNTVLSMFILASCASTTGSIKKSTSTTSHFSQSSSKMDVHQALNGNFSSIQGIWLSTHQKGGSVGLGIKIEGNQYFTGTNVNGKFIADANVEPKEFLVVSSEKNCLVEIYSDPTSGFAYSSTPELRDNQNPDGTYNDKENVSNLYLIPVGSKIPSTVINSGSSDTSDITKDRLFTGVYNGDLNSFNSHVYYKVN